ncbi:hypothetical protein C9374_008216 [Naegleria lovaniensis]|uniref:Zn(2)-C6 fungal-type domain-containing protein n=1 Tax=Naegleria lovaniensis TaxID=51637 RepID=A0AA88GFN0_NAELO|nr:uncharacterized protein C9374_008216 [Naegleria lovaniensis]KAG2378577.1 hypothetical protein C9374_008216 [Naegleria lovaniensis]
MPSRPTHEICWSEQFTFQEESGAISIGRKVTTLENEEIHPIACVQCRRLHKRCDKKMPSCSKCLSKGLTCTYAEPKKKGRTKGSSSSSASSTNNHHASSAPYITTDAYSQQNQQHEMNSVNTELRISPGSSDSSNSASSTCNNHQSLTMPPQNQQGPLSAVGSASAPSFPVDATSNLLRSVKMSIIDAYYEVVCLGYPLIERDELEKFMFGQDYANNKEMLAFVYSLQGICQQRFGYADLAYENITKASQTLKQFFDEYSNYYVVATCSMIAYFYVGEGDSKKARFYNHFVDFYLKELEQPFNEIQKNLYWVKLLIDYLSSPNFPFLLPDEMLDFFKQVLNEDMPEEWKFALYDFPNTTKSNVEERISICHMIGKRLDKRRTSSYAASVIYDIIQGCMNVGLEIALLAFVDTIYFRQKIFDLIVKFTNITENEYFVFSPPVVVTYLVISIKILLEMEKVVDSGELNTNGINYYSLLLRNYHALNVLSKRYRKVNNLYGDVIEQLNVVLQKKNAQFETFYQNPPLGPVSQHAKISRLVEFDSEVKKFFKPFMEKPSFINYFYEKARTLYPVEQHANMDQMSSSEEALSYHINTDPLTDNDFLQLDPLLDGSVLNYLDSESSVSTPAIMTDNNTSTRDW